MYNIIPPNLSSQPNIANCIVFCISFAISFTNKITTINTSIKEISGSHFIKDPALSFKYLATTTDSFNAAASPMINASNENIPTINPLLSPLKMAMMIIIIKAMSIIIMIC